MREITPVRLALEINIPEERINGILEGREPMTVDVDLRLCRLLGLSDGYWMRAQVFYESEMAMESMKDALSAIRPWKENLPRQSQYSK
jgi:addiction module HigA family antidote